MVNSSIPTPATRKPSKVEGIKERSSFLREPVATEILQDTTRFTEEAVQILKFHGSYQQDNRDNRVKGQEKDYQFMLRTKNPGGLVPPQLYLTLDKLAEEYGNQTLRVTTRQGFQLHGILKKNLKSAIAAIIENLGSTLAACGDVNRNVMAPPAPFKNRADYQYAWKYAQNIADLLAPQTGAYYEIWLDGEKAISAEEDPAVTEARQKNGSGTIVHEGEEPIYGTHYMPRKFKVCVTVPEDNSVDLFSQDLTLVVMMNQQELQGFNVYAGGGLGRTHNKEETFARLADPICYVDKEDAYDIVKAIIATQRDYGDRTDRRHARLKYLIHDWGVDKFRSMVEKYFGKPLQPFKPLPEFKYEDFLGWHEQGDGKLFLGISVQNGRVMDDEKMQLRTALREIVQQFNLPMRLTPHHNVIFYEIEPEKRQAVEEILSRCHVEADPNAIKPLVRYAMACPALPTCGLATTESERVIPSVLDRIEALLHKVGLSDEHFVIRMTGCPNGCARPYMAELGFVGTGPEMYQIWLGGSPNQTRLAQVYIEKMPLNNMEAEFEPIFVYFKQARQAEESLGDFCDRVGFPAIREFAANYTPQVAETAQPASDDNSIGNGVAVIETPISNSRLRSRHRISIRDDVYDKLKAIGTREGKTLTAMVNEALEVYLKDQL
ncbi:sulfite reductase, ferredoxin dependent [Gloeocapsopsis dulcis]|uniref:Sulfite reductase [ferredoxin] n=1 Tax=Gloeocapsopsis dulcis AAB1 = 1H9 TaxID=1433147 RepID=A0A6N8FY86_9CHRO|nr:sulfite reductase, ferredoxin dependent [Gloeocapsopsis dulcis]MUL37724.1 sulfite reductase, ferredoxin dependent [Gloeocapsopsis dulcis AAB1 = 1H9]WNN88446.1 sulfite reductase, ferredoxin dependent [Gloeocapsopsis dulcis]